MIGNGAGPGCLFLDPNWSLFNLYNSSGSGFRVQDSETSLHKRRGDDFILCLDQMYRASPHPITVRPITTFTWEFCFLAR